MAKKTKKQKILAEYRRKLQSFEGVDANISASPAFKVTSQYSLPTKQKNTNHETTPAYSITTVNSAYREPRTDYSYVLSDIYRIAILTVLAICAQLVLWYKLGRG